MTTSRRFTCDDMFNFASTNLDVLTETYNTPFYLLYVGRWPDLCITQENPSGVIMSYILGKAEGAKRDWHGHVSAVSVAPEFRRLGLARTCMAELERVSDKIHNAYFVDLFVRCGNLAAIKMYTKLGYRVFRRVLHYYGGDEDAFDMRKALVSRDPAGASMVPLKRPVRGSELWTTPTW